MGIILTYLHINNTMNRSRKIDSEKEDRLLKEKKDKEEQEKKEWNEEMLRRGEKQKIRF